MLIVTILAPYTFLFIGQPFTPNTPMIMNVLLVIFNCSMMWLFSGSPLALSFILAIYLKRNISNLILLVSTIAILPLFVYSYWQASEGGDSGFWIFTPLASLYWMIPAWIIAVILNRRYVKKATAISESQTESEA